MVDADTVVDPLSLNRLVSAMMHDKKVLGDCGEPSLANSKQSVVTMMQASYFTLVCCWYTDDEPGLRILHLPSSGQSIQESLRLGNLFAWLFHHVSPTHYRCAQATLLFDCNREMGMSVTAILFTFIARSLFAEQRRFNPAVTVSREQVR